MRVLYFTVLAALLILGCSDKKESFKRLDGKALIEQKCSSCHNLDLPPKTFEDEKAPPMMAVAFHIRDFIKAGSKAEKIPKAIEFVKDYVINPSVEKSFCDKQSLKIYGLMPSQKGLVTQDELEAIAEYMFEHFTQKNLIEAQKLAQKLKKMPKGERIATKYNCLGCHRVDKDIVGPSFGAIAEKYSGDIARIESGIKDGSAKKWKKSAIMPSFKGKMSDEEIEEVSRWIAPCKAK